MYKQLLLFAFITGSIFYFTLQSKKEEIHSQNKKQSQTINSKRQPASLPGNRKIRRTLPQPEEGRAVAALITKKFDSFKEVKKNYHLKGSPLKVGKISLYKSRFLTIPEADFLPHMGTPIRSLYGHLIYQTNQENGPKKNDNHLFIDKLTWQPTIITGKLFVKYPEGQSRLVSDQITDLGHKVTFHHQNIRRLEVQVKDRRRTRHYQKEISRAISGIKVDLELKSSEYSH